MPQLSKSHFLQTLANCPFDQCAAVCAIVPKQQAHFLYFLLESSDGFCFHSTLDQPPASAKGQTASERKILVLCALGTEELLWEVLNCFQQEHLLQLMSPTSDDFQYLLSV